MVQAPSPPTILFPASSTGGWQPVNVIVIHSAVMNLYCGAARDLSNYGMTSGLSWHYSIDNCETFQNVYDNTVAWHDGMNYGHIGIEMAEYPKTKVGRVLPGRWAGKKHKALLRRTAELVRQLCLFYDVPMVKLSRADIEAGKRGICGHANIPRRYTSHWDPGLFPWKKFMRMVRNGTDEREWDEMATRKEVQAALRDVLHERTHDSRVPGSDVTMSLVGAILNTDRHSYESLERLQTVFGDRYDRPGDPENGKFWFTTVIERLFKKMVHSEKMLAALSQRQGVDVDEAALAESLLSALTPEKIAAAISDDVAGQVVDELQRRLES